MLDMIKKRLDLSVVRNIELEDMAIDFTGPDDWISILSSDHLIAHLAHIPGFAWPVRQVQLRIIIQNNGVELGRLESPYSPATVARGQICSSITNSPMTIFQESHSAFAEFITALTTQSSHTFAIKGSADIVFDLGILGTHTLKGVDFVSDLTLRGLRSFPDIRCQKITETYPGDGYDLIVKGLFDIQNPSQLSLTLGDCTLTMSISLTDGNGDEGDGLRKQDKEHQIGTIMLHDLKLQVGLNDARAGTMVLNTSLDATDQFLKHATRKQQAVFLKGFHGTSKNEALAMGLVTLETMFMIPVFEVPHLRTADQNERE
ncbi:hypothetical protein BG011_002167 [Mortierella polycephala]|uniref:Uncharacterized protein n=1 Tax=Mortierella polycephala TaxID=41804 RepID=A0A9P6Q3U8_9FUNG|nr:hypothetical protein BG011_002167 [Mortierella polycephala]